MADLAIDHVAREKADKTAGALSTHLAIYKREREQDKDMIRTIQTQWMNGIADVRQLIIDIKTSGEKLQAQSDDRHNRSILSVAENLNKTFETVMRSTTELVTASMKQTTSMVDGLSRRQDQDRREILEARGADWEKQHDTNEKLFDRQWKIMQWLMGTALSLAGALALITVEMILKGGKLP
jgi:hypothetical protein